MIIKKDLQGFVPELIPLILDGSKYKTWRLWDDKNLQKGDKIYYRNSKTGEIFALAEIVNTTSKKMKEINKEDKKGHEDVGTYEQMLKTYSSYYQKEVTGETQVKIIEFKILKTF